MPEASDELPTTNTTRNITSMRVSKNELNAKPAIKPSNLNSHAIRLRRMMSKAKVDTGIKKRVGCLKK